MPVIEIIDFSTTPETTTESLQQALSTLDTELAKLGGMLSRELYRTAGTDNGWLLEYRWETLAGAQSSMGEVAETDAFTALMALVEAPETMRLSYGTPA